MKKVLLYESYTVSGRKPPLNYEEIVGKEFIVKPSFEYGPTYLCELKDALVSPYGIVYKNWRVVKESLSKYTEQNNHYPTLVKKLLLGKVRKVAGLSIIGINAFYNNYYHFTVESLPRLFSVKEKASEAQLLMHEHIPGFVKEYLELLGYENVVPVKDDELVRAERLLLPMHTAYNVSQSPERIREISAWLKEKVPADEGTYGDYKNIYVSRRKAAYRKILNEEAIIDLVKQYNFKVVCFEDCSIREKVQMLRHVRNFIGPHGAGFTNVMFMQEGGMVIDLIHEGHHDESMYNLASAMNHDTVFIQGAASNTDKRGVCFDDFTIDIPKLKHYLDHHLKG